MGQTEYSVKRCDIDFTFTDEECVKGKRKKKIVHVIENNHSVRSAFFKWPAYGIGELCAEKMASEIAKILGFACAQIELATDQFGQLGILNYIFTDKDTTHADAGDYFNIDDKNRAELYRLSKIEERLSSLGDNLVLDFARIMIFDALIGEQDRHEDNWGILRSGDDSLALSPLYDSSDCLARDFSNKEQLDKYESGQKDFDIYIGRSKTILRDDSGKRFKHFELIKELSCRHPDFMKEQLDVLQKLTDDKIERIIAMVPKGMLSAKHRRYVAEYLIKRRVTLLNIKNMIK